MARPKKAEAAAPKRKYTKRAPEPQEEREDTRTRDREPREERGEERERSSGRSSGRREKSDLTPIGALWAKKTKKGDRMYAGSINVGEFQDYIEQYGLKGGDRASVLVLFNNYKDEERHPDFKIFGTDPERQKQFNRGGGGGGRGRQNYSGAEREYGRGRERDGERERDGGSEQRENSLD